MDFYLLDFYLQDVADHLQKFVLFSSIFQVQRNIELHKSQRLAEKEAHDLSISLNESKEAAGKLKERVDALISTNTSLTDRISTAETDLEDASRQLENLTAQIATLRHEVLLS